MNVSLFATSSGLGIGAAAGPDWAKAGDAKAQAASARHGKGRMIFPLFAFTVVR